MPETTDDMIVIAGRRFHPATRTTFEQDMYVLELVEGAEVEGLTDATKDNLSDASWRVLKRAWKSGKLFLLLGGLLNEEGKKWSIEESKANAEFFGNLDDPADKEALNGALVGVLLSFFVSAEGFSKISLISSSANQGTESRRPANRSRGRAKNGTVVVGTTETGMASSVRSPGTILTN